MLTLYDYFRSSASFRVRIALNLKNLDYNVIPVHLVNNGGEQYSDSYRSINPLSLVPSLVDEKKVITQSIAIIEYLDEIYPSPGLLPKNAYTKALVRSFALSIAADLHPLNNLRVLNYLKDSLHIADDQKQAWYHHWIKLTFTGLEQQLEKADLHTTFCFGNEPTLADICLVPQMYNARRFNCDLKDYPLLTKIDATCQKLDAFTKAWPVETVS